MRKNISFILIIILLSNSLSSCKKQEKYEVDYPHYYTPEYCSEYYIEADTNLIHLYSAENSIDKGEIPGGYSCYYAIKDIALEDYLALKEVLLLVKPFHHKIVRKRNKDMPIQEVLSYELKKVEIYKRGNIESEDWSRLGVARVSESIVTLDSAGAASFQSHMLDCIEKGNYTEHDSVLTSSWDSVERDNALLYIRVHFSEYENLVWDARIIECNGEYCMYFYWYPPDVNGTGSTSEIIFIPLGQDISTLIPQQS